MPTTPTYNDIRYLRRFEIDERQWNACLDNATNGLVYAQTQFLDHMCPGWSGLVQGNYNAIMPLPQRRKWGIAYLFQPFQTPVLGVFGNNATANTDAFLNAIPPAFQLWDLSLNASNITQLYKQHTIPRHNFILPLCHKYAHISQGYHQQLKRSLKKAANAALFVKQDVQPRVVLALSRQQYPAFTRAMTSDFDQIERLCSQLHHQVKCYGVYNNTGVLLASAIFLHYKNRAYYWMVGNDASGRKFGASALLLDAFICDHAGTDTILDFEGSEVPGVAAFYQSFGALNEPYTTLYYNRLPPPFNRLKKMPAHYRQILALQPESGNRF